MTLEFNINQTLADATCNLTDAQKERLWRLLKRSLVKVIQKPYVKPKVPVDTWQSKRFNYIEGLTCQRTQLSSD